MERGRAFDLWYATKMPGLWPFDCYKEVVFSAKKTCVWCGRVACTMKAKGFCTKRSDETWIVFDYLYSIKMPGLWPFDCYKEGVFSAKKTCVWCGRVACTMKAKGFCTKRSDETWIVFDYLYSIKMPGLWPFDCYRKEFLAQINTCVWHRSIGWIMEVKGLMAKGFCTKRSDGTGGI